MTEKDELGPEHHPTHLSPWSRVFGTQPCQCPVRPASGNLMRREPDGNAGRPAAVRACVQAKMARPVGGQAGRPAASAALPCALFLPSPSPRVPASLSPSCSRRRTRVNYKHITYNTGAPKGHALRCSGPGGRVLAGGPINHANYEFPTPGETSKVVRTINPSRDPFATHVSKFGAGRLCR